MLAFFSRLGAKFLAHDVYLLDVCKRLNLSLARNSKRKEATPSVNASHADEHA